MSEKDESTGVSLRGGTRIPIVGFGTWQIQGKEAYRAVRTALDVGYRHIDTATVYGNEAQVGEAIADAGILRQELFVTTKVPPEPARAARATISESLSKLRMDYVDLWLVHWPPRQARLVPAIWDELLDAADSGAARAIGVSNFSIAEIDALTKASGRSPEVNQILWSPFVFEPHVQAGLAERRIVLEGYSPFKSSRLDEPVLVAIAESHGVTPAQVVVRWHVEHDVVVIPKSTDPHRIATNFDVFSFELDDREMEHLDQLSVRACDANDNRGCRCLRADW